MRRGPTTIMSSLTLLVVGMSLRVSVTGHHSAALAPAGIVNLDAGSGATPTAVPSRQPRTRRTPTPVVSTGPTPARRTPAPRTTTSKPTVRHTSSPSPKPAVKTVTVNGGSADTRYGPVQVQIQVRAGRIINADAIDYPQGSQRDQEINSYAIPQLNQETLDAQSANIDTVSGATYTSDGYRESLQSAIDAAHQAGLL
jgi:uncharacterized protein with FMN-binding domain